MYLLNRTPSLGNSVIPLDGHVLREETKPISPSNVWTQGDGVHTESQKEEVGRNVHIVRTEYSSGTESSIQQNKKFSSVLHIIVLTEDSTDLKREDVPYSVEDVG